MSTDAAAVRPGEELNLPALTAYLRGKIEGVDKGLEVEQFPGGHSNLTYLLRLGGAEYVLRRPPLGPVAPRAHDMAREFRILKAVGPHFPPAPHVYLLCEDPAVLGVTFYLMERRHGVVLRRELPPEYRTRRDLPHQASEAFVDCLAQLHAVDIVRHGLDSLGRPEGFLARQVRGWAQRWERSKTAELPQMDRLGPWLAQRTPPSPPATLVHNDFKLDNLMLDASDPGRVVAVLDWEMASVGDPLIDLGIVLCYWPQAGDPPMRQQAISPLTTQPGWFTRRQLLECYAAKTGRDLSHIGYYEVFGLYKLAVVLQQIYYRYHAGQTQDLRFREFPARIRGLADAAVLIMETLR